MTYDGILTRFFRTEAEALDRDAMALEQEAKQLIKDARAAWGDIVDEDDDEQFPDGSDRTA